MTIWQRPEHIEFRCEVRLSPESEGGYSAYAAQLPGVVSEGETIGQAENNIAEALRATLETYRGNDEPVPWIPWDKVEPVQGAEIGRFVFVRVKPCQPNYSI